MGGVAKLAASFTPPTGWVVKTNWVAEPTVMVMALLVAEVSPLEVAVSV